MTSPDQEDLEFSKLVLPIQTGDHVHGVPEALYTLVEYGDYECPDCGRLFAIIRELQGKSSGTLRLVFRHYPLSGLHPHAQLAAEAAEAANAQGRFWEMHDLLFQNQNALGTKHLYEYAEQLSLDTKRFHNDLKKRTYEDLVRADFRRGVEDGVYGTPGLFINGIRDNSPLAQDSTLERLRHETGNGDR